MIKDMLEFLGVALQGIAMFVVLFLVLGGMGYGIYLICDMNTSPETKAQRRQAEIELATPKLYSVTDGCSVYRWYAEDHAHYFTKCQDKVITESNHTESCGKACSKTVTETIETARTR